MCQDTQGARQEVPLPPAPAAAALLAAHEHCGEEDALGAPSTPYPHAAASRQVRQAAAPQAAPRV